MVGALGVAAALGLSTAVAAAAAPSVRTVAGAGGSGRSGSLSAPSGVALDAAGDLFIADTDHCRVVLVPSHSGTLYGLRVHAGQATTLAGGSCGGTDGLGYPTGVAVDHGGDVFIAEATAQRVQMIHAGGHAPVNVVGTGVAGYNGEGLPGPQSELNHPTGIAVDAAGTLYIADTANCRLRVVPAADGTYFGQTMQAQHLYTVAGTGVCGSAQRSGSAAAAQLWNPVAVTTDHQGDLFIADGGDQSILEVPVQSGTDYGTTIEAGGIGTVVGEGGNGPYLQDGLPANGETAELNDPEGIAVNSAGALFMTDGSQHCVRVVPATTSTMFGRTMQGGDLYTVAGALPVDNASGQGNGTRWVLAHMGIPVGLAVSASGSVLFSDRSAQKVLAIG
jgi:sugar lactone lactonase YvrE